MKNNKMNYNPNITEEDKKMLGEQIDQQHNDHLGDDEQLLNRKKPVDFTGKDLDVPNRELAVPGKKVFKDEENELYSLADNNDT